MLSKAISVAGIALWISLVSVSAHAQTGYVYPKTFRFDPNLGTLQSITITTTLEEGLQVGSGNYPLSGTFDDSATIIELLVVGPYYLPSSYLTFGGLTLTSGLLSYNLAPDTDETFQFSGTLVQTLGLANLQYFNSVGPATPLFTDIAAGQDFSLSGLYAGGAATVFPTTGGFPAPFGLSERVPGETNEFGSVGSGGIASAIVTYSYLSAAPEPSVWSLMILGLGLCGAALRRRRGVLKGIGIPAGSSSR